jgi:uncharacterized protein YdeI (YjbR/CyaY-like superfamily)
MELHFEDRERWRQWLEAHHDSAEVIWLVFYKKHTGTPTISYDAAVEEALCFGWVDSLIKRLDEDRYARKFTPRRDNSRWSAANLERFRKLVASGRMTPAGLEKIAPDVEPVTPPSGRSTDVPEFLTRALAENPSAREFFERLAPSYRQDFIAWVSSAKREDTRSRRLAEAILLLERGDKLGMK